METVKHNNKKIITIIGASGFVGQHLLRYLLAQTDYQLRAVCRHPETITFNVRYKHRVQLIKADIFDKTAITQTLINADAAVYLVHMMAAKGDYYKLEAKAAHVLAQAAEAATIPRILFLGGLGDDAHRLSRHLRSRHNSGKILREGSVTILEFRASMIVGDGSVAYDIIKSLVHKLPVQTMPAWATTKTQPITLHNALEYLAAGLDVPLATSEVVEIGGPEQLSYEDLVRRYANFCGRKPILVIVPIVPLWLGAWWLNLFTPRHHARVGRQMVESLVNPMIVTNDVARQLFPNIKLEPIERAFTNKS